MRLAEQTTPQAKAEYVNKLVDEVIDSDRHAQWAARVDPWLESYIQSASSSPIIKILDGPGGRYDTIAAPISTTKKITINRIQNCVISMAAVQASDPPKRTFTPRETGEPPLVYLNTNLPEADPYLQQLAAGGFDVTKPLREDIAEQLRQMVQQSEQLAQQAMMAGLPPPPGILPKELIFEITDSTAAEWLKTVHEGATDAADFPFHFTQNTLDKNIFGWVPTKFWVDPDTRAFMYKNLNPKHVFIDPLATDIKSAAYVVEDEIIGEEEAKARYPQWKKAIERAGSESLKWPGGKQYNISSVYEQNFSRNMVVLRHAWIRFQPYPMSRDEAMQSGMAQVKQVPTGFTTMAADETGMPMEVPEMRDGVFVGEEEVDETSPTWPRRYGIKKITVIGDEAVGDEECEYADINIAVNVNIPIPYSPLGQGEPERLIGLQEALNLVVSSLVTHHAYTAYPPEVIWQSVYDKLPVETRDARTRPDRRIVVPDELKDRVGGDITKLIATLDIPSMSTDAWKLIEFLMMAIDKEGNQSEVLQGEASGSWSGDAIGKLQSAASQVIRFKSGRAEHYLNHLTELEVDAIARYFTLEDCRRYSTKYPDAVHQAFHDRVKRLHFDIDAEISSGSGAAKQAETNNLVAARGSGVQIPDSMIVERLGLNPDEVQQKRMEQARNESRMLQLQPVQADGKKPSPSAQAEPT